MAALGFKKQFVAPIKRKKNPKDQTIRGFRKIPIVPGERLYLFTGMRTRHCKKIGEAVCNTTTDIVIDENGYSTGGSPVPDNNPFWHSREDIVELNEFAKRDGFRSWQELIEFWKVEHGDKCFPFHGTLIRFRLLPKKHWKKLVPESKLA